MYIIRHFAEQIILTALPDWHVIQELGSANDMLSKTNKISEAEQTKT